MASRVIRVDSEVHRFLVVAKARLETAVSRPCSISEVVAFLLALTGVEPQDCPKGQTPQQDEPAPTD